MDTVIRPEPIWAKNPKTGKEVNVEPLFRLINEEVFEWGNTPKDLKSRIDDIIEYVGKETVSSEWNNTEFKIEDFQRISMRQINVFENLFELKDMFELMIEREK